MSKKLDKKIIIKFVFLFVLISVIVGATILILPWINQIKTEEGREALMLYIESQRAAGAFIFIGIQAIQVLLPIVPPIQIIGGALFGTFLGSVFSFAGIYLGMSIVYGLVRIVGYPLVEVFVNKKDLKKFRFLREPNRIALVFFIIYLIPGMPKDTISFFAPLTDMNKKTYFLYVLPARFPLIFLSAVFGAAVRDGNYILAVILSIVMIDVGIIGIVFREKVIHYFEKFSKTTKASNTEKEMINNHKMKKTGLLIIIASAFVLVCDFIFMLTNYFSICRAEFLKYHDLKGHNQVIYFIFHYGMYWLVSVAAIGITVYVYSTVKQRKFSAKGINN